MFMEKKRHLWGIIPHLFPIILHLKFEQLQYCILRRWWVEKSVKQILGRPISGTVLVSRRVALNPYPVAHLLIPKHHQSKNSQRCAHVQFYHFKFWFEQLQQCNMEVEHARFDELCTYYRWWLFPYPFGKKKQQVKPEWFSFSDRGRIRPKNLWKKNT